MKSRGRQQQHPAKRPPQTAMAEMTIDAQAASSAPSVASDAEDEGCAALRVVKLSQAATLPQRASAGAAGYDLCAAEQTTISPGSRKVVKTDLAIAVPPHHYGRVAPRSGLSFRFGIDIGAGVIDSVRAAPACRARTIPHTCRARAPARLRAGLPRSTWHCHDQQRHKRI